MTIKLYALKCQEGYIRYKPGEEINYTGLDKASVYNQPGDPALQEAIRQAVAEKPKDLRMVELQLTEVDYQITKIPVSRFSRTS